jgi:uncharacterized phage infection (PIP) family protein YhgE
MRGIDDLKERARQAKETAAQLKDAATKADLAAKAKDTAAQLKDAATKADLAAKAKDTAAHTVRAANRLMGSARQRLGERGSGPGH